MAVEELAEMETVTGLVAVVVALERPVRMRPRTALALQTRDEPGLVAQAGHPPLREPRCFTPAVAVVERTRVRLRLAPGEPVVVAPVEKARQAQMARPGQVVAVVRVAIPTGCGPLRVETADPALSSFAM
jgi:hypothetical protein